MQKMGDLWWWPARQADVSRLRYNINKGGRNTLYQRIQKEQKRLQQEINSLQKALEVFPKGKLVIGHQGNSCKWYQSDGSTKKYIPKANKPLAEQLAIKKYLSCELEDLFHEKKALDFYLRHHRTDSEKAELLLDENSEYAKLLSPYFKPLSQELDEWMNAPYEQNPKHPEHLVHKTSSGHFVRSKSEAMINMFLHTNHIPFRYECALYLDNVPFYPDFTIRHPQTGALFYWEHFGMMDDPSYCKSAASKLQTYIAHGMIPSIQLITTYETKQNPLTTEMIQKIIEHYFL